MTEKAVKRTVMVTNSEGKLVPKKEPIKKHNFMKPKIQTPMQVAESAIRLVQERERIEETLNAKIAEMKSKLEEASASKVTINSPGHKLHGKQATVFHRHDDGRINVQVQNSQKRGDVTNLTLKPGQFNESEELDESTRVEISKKEFDTLAAKHAAAKATNRTGKYANATYVYDDKEKNNGLNRGVVHQIHSHDAHGLPTIETGGGKHYKFIKESESLDEVTSPFDWKNYKSQIDWSKDKWDDKKDDEDGVTTHKAGQTKPKKDPNEPKKSVGRPKGKYGSYLKADQRTDDERKAIAAKVHANPERKKSYADAIAARREFKELMNNAIKKRQAELHSQD